MNWPPVYGTYPTPDCELPERGNIDRVARRQDILTTGSRKHGASMRQFQTFVAAADGGNRVVMHAQNYVAMSRNVYEKLVSKPVAAAYVDEAGDMKPEVFDALKKKRGARS